MRPLIAALLFTVSFLAASAAMSTVPISEYKANKEDKQKWPITLIYLNGVGVGATVTSSALALQGKPRPFCQPEEIVLNEQSYIKLIDALIAKNDIPEDTPVENVLVMALAVAFPC